MPGEAFRPEDRLRSRSEFRAAQSLGKKVHAPHFLLMVLPRSDAGRARLGITVTKKVSSTAVGRNRVKRVVREVFRKNRDLFPPGCDVVVIAKRGSPALGYADVLDEIRGASPGMHRKAGA